MQNLGYSFPKSFVKCANYIEHPDLEPPFLCLIVSGGHTHLVIVKDYGEFEILGRALNELAGRIQPGGAG